MSKNCGLIDQLRPCGNNLLSAEWLQNSCKLCKLYNITYDFVVLNMRYTFTSSTF